MTIKIGLAMLTPLHAPTSLDWGGVGWPHASGRYRHLRRPGCHSPFDGSHPSPERIQGTHLVSQSPTLKWVAGGVWDEESGGRCQSKGSEVLVASVATRTNGVNACTDGVHLRDAEWVFSAPSRNGLKSRREDLVHRVCASPRGSNSHPSLPDGCTPPTSSASRSLTRCLILLFQPGLHTGVTGTLSGMPTHPGLGVDPHLSVLDTPMALQLFSCPRF